MEIIVYLSSIYALGYFIKICTMALNDTVRAKNAEKAGLTVDPLYSMEEYLILPALWPKDAWDFFVKGLR